VRQSI